MKHNAANTKVLATIKFHFNHKIYAKALAIYNAQGEDAMWEYMKEFSTANLRQALGY